MNENQSSNEIKKESVSAVEVDAAHKELEKITKERDEYLAGWQRAKADFVNAKKTWEQNMSEFKTMANEELIAELLPVLQSFEMAFANKDAWEKADKNWRMGVEYIHTQLKAVVEQNGLKEINPVGAKFEPTLHEAIRYEETSDASKAGTITSVIEKGYMLGSKLIKPAKVVVAESKS
jgi:molecular chaperone GrpE